MEGIFHSQDSAHSGRSGSGFFEVTSVLNQPLINKPWKAVETHSCLMKVRQSPCEKVKNQNLKKIYFPCDMTYQDFFVLVIIGEISIVA